MREISTLDCIIHVTRHNDDVDNAHKHILIARWIVALVGLTHCMCEQRFSN